MENREVDGNVISIGVETTYFGAMDGETPEMLNPKENGIIKNENGEVIATFANVAQAIASLFLSRYSIPQIKTLIPQIKNVSGATIVKMVNDTSSRAIRKDFIESLGGNMPRQLTVVETVKVMDVVGAPSSKAIMVTLDKVLSSIKLDMANVGLIVPVRKTRAVAAMTKEDIQVRIDRTIRSIARSEKKIAHLNEKLATLEKNEASEKRDYDIAKTRMYLEDAISFMNASQVKLQNFEEEIVKFVSPVEPVA